MFSLYQNTLEPLTLERLFLGACSPAWMILAESPNPSPIKITITNQKLDGLSLIEEVRLTKLWTKGLLRDEWKRQVKKMDDAVKENMKSEEYRKSLNPEERS